MAQKSNAHFSMDDFGMTIAWNLVGADIFVDSVPNAYTSDGNFKVYWRSPLLRVDDDAESGLAFVDVTVQFVAECKLENDIVPRVETTFGALLLYNRQGEEKEQKGQYISGKVDRSALEKHASQSCIDLKETGPQGMAGLVSRSLLGIRTHEKNLIIEPRFIKENTGTKLQVWLLHPDLDSGGEFLSQTSIDSKSFSGTINNNFLYGKTLEVILSATDTIGVLQRQCRGYQRAINNNETTINDKNKPNDNGEEKVKKVFRSWWDGIRKKKTIPTKYDRIEDKQNGSIIDQKRKTFLNEGLSSGMEENSLEEEISVRQSKSLRREQEYASRINESKINHERDSTSIHEKENFKRPIIVHGHSRISRVRDTRRRGRGKISIGKMI